MVIHLSLMNVSWLNDEVVKNITVKLFNVIFIPLNKIKRFEVFS